MTQLKKTLSLTALALLGGCMLSLTSCKKEPQKKDQEVKGDFYLAYSSGSGSQTTIFLQAMDDISKGEISFEGKGWKLMTGRTSHLYVTSDRSLYSLRYRDDNIDKVLFGKKNSEDFSFAGTIDSRIPLGGKGFRFTTVNDEVGSIHLAETKANDQNDPSKGAKTLVTIGLLDLKTMTVKKAIKADEVKLPNNLSEKGYAIGRMHNPTVAGNKIYYGIRIDQVNPGGKGKTAFKSTMLTGVLAYDYPSMTNAKVILFDKEYGATCGYRMRSLYTDENGEVIVQASTGKPTHMLKIKEGKFTDYDLDLSAKLGVTKGANSHGFVYAGNGICFIPYENADLPKHQVGVDPNGEPTYFSQYGICRVDLKNKNVVNLEVPEKLWLFQYQTARIINGKIYFALAPVGGEGNIYIYNVNSESAKATIGAKIKAGADQYYIGIY